MLKKKKLYSRPRKAYEKTRISEENVLVEMYGLKSKREVWKTLAKVKYFRDRAKELAKAGTEEQEVLFNKLKKIGLKVNSISDVLDLKIEDLLNRRLPTVVKKLGFANTVKQARQMVVHKNVRIDGRVVNIPSYLVSTEEENKIKAKTPAKPKPKAQAEKVEEKVAPAGEAA